MDTDKVKAGEWGGRLGGGVKGVGERGTFVIVSTIFKKRLYSA